MVVRTWRDSLAILGYTMTHKMVTHVILGQSLSLLQVHYDGGSGEHLKLRPGNEQAVRSGR